MAAGEAAGADGRAWIAAAAVAYEVQCRLCDAASIRARGWDHTTYGSISAALAAVEADGPVARPDLARPGDRRHDRHGPAADPGRRTLDVEGLRVRLRRPQRRLRRDPRLGRDDRPRPALRRRHGVLPAGLRPVRPAEARRPGRRTTGCCPKTSIKFVPAEYHSQSAIAAAFELRPRIGDPARIRSIEIATFRDGRRDHRPGPREVAAEDPRDGRPQPALLHGRRARRRRGLGRAVHARTAHRPGLARPRRPDDGRRRPRADAGLPVGHPEPGLASRSTTAGC